MTDDISKVDRALSCGCVVCICEDDERCHGCGAKCCERGPHGIKSATTPAEVDAPTIDRDEAFQRDYIPLGRSGWEIQTKGKGSTYRLCEPDGHRLAIPNEPYLHETLTRMARAVHADYATLARQLAEARTEADETANNLNMMIVYWREATEQAESQLAEATRRLGEVEAYRDATFDGNAVYAALDDRAKARTSADNVADVLDALNRVARLASDSEGGGK